MHYAVPLTGPEVHPIETGDDPVRVSRKSLNAPAQFSLSQRTGDWLAPTRASGMRKTLSRKGKGKQIQMKAKTAQTSQAAKIARRDRIVIEHLPLVKAIAIRVHENLPVHVDLDDLVHAGVLGLFDAASKFDSTKNVVFHSYAKHRIKGAILDSLRQLDWASRDLRKRQKQVDAVTHDLSAKLGRNPTESEVAKELGVTVDRWRHMLLELRNVGLVSSTVHPDQDRDRFMEFPATPEFQPDRMCEHRIGRASCR